MPATPIDTVRDPALVRRAWSTVFTSTDPFRVPFRPELGSLVILCPTDGYHLDPQQYSAITTAANRIRDGSFLVSVVEYGEDFVEKGEHWLCTDLTYRDYLRLPLVLENAIYSCDGRWGCLVSHEDHALVSGLPEFMAALRENYPDWRTDAERFRAAWQGASQPDWVLSLLARVPPR